MLTLAALPMADDAITRAVYKVWDLPCISVGKVESRVPAQPRLGVIDFAGRDALISRRLKIVTEYALLVY